MVPDPYKALQLNHDASKAQIKNAYRTLALEYHPDRLTRKCASEEEMKAATHTFAKISTAYALLNDERRKREYDHIYKYGGYDDFEEETKTNERRQPQSSSRAWSGFNSSANPKPFTQSYGNQQQQEDPFLCPKRDARGNPVPQKGIGYAYTDHLSNLFSQGKYKSKAVAGIQIPSRLHLSRQAGGGLKFAFASGELVETPEGTKTFKSKTTQFVSGKKFSRVETTTVHTDGRKEIVIEGNDYIERRFSPPTKKAMMGREEENVAQQDDGHLPWYMSAWHGIKDSITMCYNPCIPVR